MFFVVKNIIACLILFLSQILPLYFNLKIFSPLSLKHFIIFGQALDKTMPHFTGFDLAREIRKIRSDILIILCTGLNEKTDLATAQETGIEEFIMKPINKQKIAKTIRKALDKKH